MWRFAPARSATRQAPPKRAAPAVPDHARLYWSGFLWGSGPFVKFRAKNSLLKNYQIPPTRDSKFRKADRAPQITHTRAESYPYSHEPTRPERKPRRGPGLHVRRSA